jgi:hypothetical protein
MQDPSVQQAARGNAGAGMDDFNPFAADNNPARAGQVGTFHLFIHRLFPV